MRTLSYLRFWILALVLAVFPASILLENALAQSDFALAARFSDTEQTSLFHEGTSSSSQVAVLFNQPVRDFGVDTPSIVVKGGEVESARIMTLESPEGATSPLYVFTIRSAGNGPISFTLIEGRPCEWGGICTGSGARLRYAPSTKVIPGPSTLSFEQDSYSGSGGIPGEVSVTLDPLPHREVVVPLTVTYQDSLVARNVTGIPSSLSFGPQDVQQSFDVRPSDEGFEGDIGTVTIGFGELPPGVRTGNISSVEVEVHDDQVWAASLTVRGTGEYLGYTTFTGVEQGEISVDDLSWRGIQHAVTNLVFSTADDIDASHVSIEFSPGIKNDTDCLYLVLGDLALNLADGEVNDRQFFWYGVDLDWQIGESISIGMKQYPQNFRVRSSDGRGNNPAQFEWGMAGTPLIRETTVSYMDRVSEAPTWLPNPRTISNTAQSQSTSMPNEALASDMVWQWGQFLDHDISLTPAGTAAESLNIAVPTGDATFDPGGSGLSIMTFTRSEFDPDTGTAPENPRDQVNIITAYIDASQVYGSEGRRSRVLRVNDGSGKLRTSGNGRFLMYNTVGLDNDGGRARRDLFLSGDVRANEQVGLTALHTLFVREHNRIAAETRAEYPGLSGDEIYQISRKIVGALIQNVTYSEFLPKLLGEDALAPYTGYDASVEPNISTEFSTAAFRVGHTMLSSRLLRVDARGNQSSLSLANAFFEPTHIEDRGISEFLRGLTRQRAQEVDALIVDEVRNLLFSEGGRRGLDLAALNIQRGRDHGLASYNNARRVYSLTPAVAFSDVSTDIEVQQALRDLYGDIDSLELWVGGLAEDHVDGAMVGETFHTIISDQFRRLRDGDRFWFENDPYFLANPDLLSEIRSTTLADIIRRNTPIGDEIPDDVFTVSSTSF